MEFRHCGIRWFRFRREALEALPSALGMIFIAVAMNLAFLVYGLLKEELVTRDHFSSIYIVIASRMSVIPALLGVLFVQSAGVEGEGAHAPQNDVSWVVRLLGAPLTMFAFFSFANDTSTWAGCEMLKYVSLAVQVMAKSASVLPNRSTTLGSTCKPSFWSPLLRRCSWRTRRWASADHLPRPKRMMPAHGLGRLALSTCRWEDCCWLYFYI